MPSIYSRKAALTNANKYESISFYQCVCGCVCVWLCVCVVVCVFACMCVCVFEKDRETEKVNRPI